MRVSSLYLLLQLMNQHKFQLRQLVQHPRLFPSFRFVSHDLLKVAESRIMKEVAWIWMEVAGARVRAGSRHSEPREKEKGAQQTTISS